MERQWSPKRTLEETSKILCAPGQMHELQSQLINGQLHRVYKNLLPSVRTFWIWAAQEHKDATFAVFENQRYTYSQVFERSVKAAAMFYEIYGIRKGDRVSITSRNYPEFLVAFWACQLIGAVSVLLNAWSPLEVLRHCLVNTECKLVIVDPERADTLEVISKELSAECGSTGILVFQSHEGKGKWHGMKTWDTAFEDYKSGAQNILSLDPPRITPEDDAIILFTSGTTGLPKGVLITQSRFLGAQITFGGLRANLRRGEDLPQPETGPQKGILISVPLFHVTGLSLCMVATMTGSKIVMMRKWNAEEGAKLFTNENIKIAGGVPSMVLDLVESSGSGHPLDSLMFGGAPAPSSLASRSQDAFPAARLSQGYGLTETSGVVVGFAGEDYLARPTSCGLASPINDIMIMNNELAVPAGIVGEVWIRGPNVMKCYWRDPVSTNKVLTSDGWFKSGDLGFLDEEGFLYIRDRIKDIIIRGGENIDSVSIENALYVDQRVLEVAAVGVPDKKLGELVTAVVSIKPVYKGQVTERSLIAVAQKGLPKFAVPVMIVIQNEPFDRTPSGKILKAELRKLAAVAWLERSHRASFSVKL